MPLTPQSNVEKYLSVIAGHGGEIPSAPASRVEYYLDQIVKNGGIGGKLKPEIVATLPATGQSGVLYLLPSQSGSGKNVHNEYIWIEDESKFELLGQTTVDIDLSGYVPNNRKVGGRPLTADIGISVTASSSLTVIDNSDASNVAFSISHDDSGVTAGSKGDATNQTPGFGGKFKALSVTVDAKGHVTALEEHSVKIPDTEATQSAKGLMSASDKKKLDTLIDNTLSNAGQAADAKRTGDKITALESENALLRELINGIDAPIYRTASGNPATFADGYAANVKALSVTLSPTQEGEGDPYPPGGGKNLLDISALTSTNEVEVTNADLTTGTAALKALVTANTYGDVKYTTTLKAGTYTLSGTVSSSASGAVPRVMIARVSDGNTVAVITNTSSSFSFTLSTETKVFIIARLNQSQSISTGDSCTASNVMLRFSDTDPTFAPYSNIRPISGVSSVSVTRTGKNLWCLETATSRYNDITYTIDKSAGNIKITGQSGNGNTVWFTVARNVILYPGNYTLSTGLQYNDIQISVNDGNTSISRTGASGVADFTLNKKTICTLYVWCNRGINFNDTIYPMLRRASDPDPTFEPYQGQTVAVQLTDGADPLTVYGGTLDVTTGALSVTHKIVTESGWTFSSGTTPHGFHYAERALSHGNGDIVSNMFPYISNENTAWDSGTPSVTRTSFGLRVHVAQNSLAEFQSQYAGLQIVYPLAEPITYQLTPQQLATLSGYNSVTTDAETLSVTYRADPSITLGG